jgi:hypothetical protein
MVREIEFTICEPGIPGRLSGPAMIGKIFGVSGCGLIGWNARDRLRIAIDFIISSRRKSR